MRPKENASPIEGVILIAALSGFSFRYMLRTGFLDSLKNKYPKDNFLCLISSDQSITKNEFSSDSRISYEFIDTAKIRAESSSRIGGLCQIIRKCVLDHRLDSGTADYWFGIFIRDYSKLGRSYSIKGRLLWIIIWILRHSPKLRKFFRFLEGFLLHSESVEDLFQKNRVKLVITPSAGVFHTDALLIRSAKKRRIKTIGLVTNWDHTVSKGTAAITPDVVLSWGEKMSKELQIHHDVSPQNINVVGPLHYDHYFSREQYCQREAFMSDLGLNPDRETILYAAMSPRTYPWNPKVIEFLASTCERGGFNKETQLLVRLHPNHLHGLYDWTEQWEAEEAAYKKISERYTNTTIVYPKGVGGRGTFSLDETDTTLLANCVFHSSIVVCFFSTMNLEAALLDKPTINVNMYRRERRGIADRIPVTSLSHLQTLIRHQSGKIVSGEEDLVVAIEKYLRDPKLDSNRRKAMVSDIFGEYTGQALKRAIEAVSY